MSTTSSNFDPRQAIEGLFGYVKDMATSSLKGSVKSQPDSERVEAAVLASLESGSKTAAQIVKAIRLAAGETWAPTDGQVNSSLARLLASDSVSVKTKGDRKTYSLTKKGEAALDEARENLAETPSITPASKLNMNFNWMTCDSSFLTAASKLPPVMLDIAQTGTKEQQIKAAAILDKVRHDLHVVLAEK